ncbi:YjzD family protein [Caldibacillus lycopersici]|uniref:YjzD family protein n=1 Tax=Perspicuibacillus lycopersici TaxID=1325689 RepID=A0AAE3LS79_9BACI|nr:YjzD family protein [Perspicuibacillus lycopersici]MCU9612448.1 YjzD family protein [Perspicuibacillus lycopersici]
MKVFWTFLWTFLLTHMLTYVVGSMSGAAYDFVTATLLSVGITIFVLIIPTILPNDNAEQTH